ncbi:MAG: hypothetical protein IPF48_12840 [Sphingomonadales bacterium]|nr:hypothetical protein [Sphingomonadales bacterium]
MSTIAVGKPGCTGAEPRVAGVRISVDGERVELGEFTRWRCGTCEA